MPVWWSLSNFNPQCVPVCMLWSMIILEYILEFGLAQKSGFYVILSNILKSSLMMNIRCSQLTTKNLWRKWDVGLHCFEYNTVFLLMMEKMACFWLSTRQNTGILFTAHQGQNYKSSNIRIILSMVSWANKIRGLYIRTTWGNKRVKSPISHLNTVWCLPALRAMAGRTDSYLNCHSFILSPSLCAFIPISLI